MIDFMVAHDILAGFETADEIAQFLIGQGVKAFIGSATSCAISKWMKDVTGNDSIVTTYGSIGYRTEGTRERLSCTEIEGNTDAMADFVSNFDNRLYPTLVLGGLGD